MYLSQSLGMLKENHSVKSIHGMHLAPRERRLCLHLLQLKDLTEAELSLFFTEGLSLGSSAGTVGAADPKPAPSFPGWVFPLPKATRSCRQGPSLLLLYCSDSAPTPRSSCFPALPGKGLAKASLLHM